MHVWYDRQVWLQVPQFNGSALVSAQVSPHRVWLSVQVQPRPQAENDLHWHCPLTQAEYGPQAFPHAPQFAVSLASMQAPLQIRYGDWQGWQVEALPLVPVVPMSVKLGATQVYPAAQSWMVEQVLLQVAPCPPVVAPLVSPVVPPAPVVPTALDSPLVAAFAELPVLAAPAAPEPPELPDPPVAVAAPLFPLVPPLLAPALKQVWGGLG
jgi:hypothetical protein